MAGLSPARIPDALAHVREARRPALLFFNGIGDHLLTLPALRALAAIFPGKLTLICMPGARSILVPDAPLGRVSDLELRSGLFDPDAVASDVGECDVFMCLNRSSSESIVRLLDRLSPRESIGFFPDFRTALPFRNDKHSADQAFDLPRAIDPSLRLSDFAGPPVIPGESHELLRAMRGALPGGSRLLVVHADTKPAKMWPVSHFVEVLNAFLDRHPDFFVLVVGTRDIGLKAGRFACRILPCQGLPLTTSMTLVGAADLFLGVDSSMLHAADLFRVPSVGLFVPGSHVEFGFRFGPHRYVFGETMESIRTEEVLAALEAMLAEPADALQRTRHALLAGVELRRRLCDEQASSIVAAAALIAESLRRGGKLLLCGNGGSAADCQHIAAELTGRFGKHMRPALPALSLTTDTSALTAIANDFGYEHVFARQVEALGRRGDVLLALSTSGSSPSVLRAASRGRALGLRVIAVTGPADAPLHELAALTIRAPGGTSDRIQELHISIGHILCDLIEQAIAPAPPAGVEGAS